MPNDGGNTFGKDVISELQSGYQIYSREGRLGVWLKTFIMEETAWSYMPFWIS